jgi:hypothetical protein
LRSFKNRTSKQISGPLRIPLKSNLKRVLGHGMQVGLSILRNQSKTSSALNNIISQSAYHPSQQQKAPTAEQQLQEMNERQQDQVTELPTGGEDVETF